MLNHQRVGEMEQSIFPARFLIFPNIPLAFLLLQNQFAIQPNKPTGGKHKWNY